MATLSASPSVAPEPDLATRLMERHRAEQAAKAPPTDGTQDVMTDANGKPLAYDIPVYKAPPKLTYNSCFASVAKKLRSMGEPYYPNGKQRSDYHAPLGMIGDAPTLGMETVEVKRAKPKAPKTVRLSEHDNEIIRERLATDPYPYDADDARANEPDSTGVNWRYQYELAVVTVKLLRSAVARLQGELEKKGVPLSDEMQHEFEWLGFEHGRDTREITLITA